MMSVRNFKVANPSVIDVCVIILELSFVSRISYNFIFVEAKFPRGMIFVVKRCASIVHEIIILHFTTGSLKDKKIFLSS